MTDDIRSRIKNARLLTEQGQWYDGFLLGLIAFAGVSRRRYPAKKAEYPCYFNKKLSRHPAQQSQINAAIAKRKSQVLKNNDRRFLSDREAFQCLVFDELESIILPGHSNPPRLNVAFPFGPLLKKTNIEDILYEYHRCTVVHEGKFAKSLELTDPIMQIDGSNIVYSDVVKLSLPNGWPKGWVENVINTVENCQDL